MLPSFSKSKSPTMKVLKLSIIVVGMCIHCVHSQSAIKSIAVTNEIVSEEPELSVENVRQYFFSFDQTSSDLLVLDIEDRTNRTEDDYTPNCIQVQLQNKSVSILIMQQN